MPVTLREIGLVKEEIAGDIAIYKAALPFTQCETVAELMAIPGVYANLAALTSEEKQALLSKKSEVKAKAAAMKLIGPKAAKAAMIAEMEETVRDPAAIARARRLTGI